MKLRQKTMAFLRDEGGASRIEYAVLVVIIILAIVLVVSTLIREGR